MRTILALMVLTSCAAAEPRRVQSGPTRTSVLELYSSEGCSSCPPAEDFVNGISDDDKMVVLAFHVDYWDEIGWPDRFASPRWTARQHARSPSLYTPELMLDGREVRGALDVRTEPAAAQLELVLDGTKATLRAQGGRRLYLAVTESQLVVHVGAGENRGRTLRHDHVVRELYGPFDAAHPAVQTLSLAPGWNRAHLRLVGFVENERGEILNAVHTRLE
jgi:hypothetical protein